MYQRGQWRDMSQCKNRWKETWRGQRQGQNMNERRIWKDGEAQQEPRGTGSWIRKEQTEKQKYRKKKQKQAMTDDNLDQVVYS